LNSPSVVMLHEFMLEKHEFGIGDFL